MSFYGTPINESPVIVVKAGEAIEAPAFLAVTADGKVATAGANAIGIVTPSSDDAVAEGDDLNVQVKDIGTWIAGGAVELGAELTSDATGKAVTASGGDFITAIALEAATAAGQRIPVQICKCGYKPAG